MTHGSGDSDHGIRPEEIGSSSSSHVRWNELTLDKLRPAPAPAPAPPEEDPEGRDVNSDGMLYLSSTEPMQ